MVVNRDLDEADKSRIAGVGSRGKHYYLCSNTNPIEDVMRYDCWGVIKLAYKEDKRLPACGETWERFREVRKAIPVAWSTTPA